MINDTCGARPVVAAGVVDPPYPLGTGRMKSRTLTALIPGLPSDTRGAVYLPPSPSAPGQRHCRRPTPVGLPWTSADLPWTSVLKTRASLFSDLFFRRFRMRFWIHLGSILGSKIAEKLMIF